MRLRHIEIFHAVYTTGSITAASKLLNVSQPAVSKVLNHAELQLGFLLFNRIKGRLSPTNEAILLFEEVDRIYQQINTINDAAENIKNNEVGRISLALTPALGFDVIPSAIASFKKTNPKVTYDIQTVHNDQVQEHLQKYKSEIAVMFSPINLPDMDEINYGKGKLVVVYPKSLLPHSPSKISLVELTQYPLISIWNSGPLAHLIMQAMKQQNIKPSNSIKVLTYFIAVSLVKHEVGLCIVDEFTARSQLTENIAMAELDEQIEFPIKCLFLKNKPLSQVTRNFLGALERELITW